MIGASVDVNSTPTGLSWYRTDQDGDSRMSSSARRLLICYGRFCPIVSAGRRIPDMTHVRGGLGRSVFRKRAIAAVFYLSLVELHALVPARSDGRYFRLGVALNFLFRG